MPKDTKTLGNSKARACESLGFVHKKGCARVLTQPHCQDSAESIVHTNQTYDHIRSMYMVRMQMFSTYDHNWDIFQSILPGSIGL